MTGPDGAFIVASTMTRLGDPAWAEGAEGGGGAGGGSGAEV